jgi:hypothetical protein
MKHAKVQRPLAGEAWLRQQLATLETIRPEVQRRIRVAAIFTEEVIATSERDALEIALARVRSRLAGALNFKAAEALSPLGMVHDEHDEPLSEDILRIWSQLANENEERRS